MAGNKILPILLLFLAACGTDRSVQTAELTGFYEGRGNGEQQSQLCMISAPSGSGPSTASFGIVTIGSGDAACSGAGQAVREGDVLRLAMGGEEECVIEARITDDQVAFPAALPETCAYYCSPGASLANETFEKTGGAAEDALGATNLAGGPLCG